MHLHGEFFTKVFVNWDKRHAKKRTYRVEKVNENLVKMLIPERISQEIEVGVYCTPSANAKTKTETVMFEYGKKVRNLW